MKRSTRWLIYLAVLIVSAGFFLYRLFPSDAFRQYVALELSRAFPPAQVTIGRAGLESAFPPGIRFEQIDIVYLGKSVLLADTVKLWPSLVSLLGNTRHMAFEGAAAKGGFKGTADVPGSRHTGELKVDVDLENIRLDDVPGISQLIKREVAGSLEGSVSFTTRAIGAAGNGKAHLVLSDCRIQLQSPMIPLDSVAFNTIEADISIAADRLDIKRCDLKGNQMDADFTGSIVMANPPGKSVLNLRGTVNPHPILLAGIRSFLSVDSLTGGRQSGGGISVRIVGTVDSPGVTFR